MALRQREEPSDAATYDALVKKYGKALERFTFDFVRWSGGNTDQADDVYVITLRRIYQNLHTIRSESVLSWMCSIAKHCAFDIVIRPKRYLSLDAFDTGDGESHTRDISDDRVNVESDVIAREYMKHVLSEVHYGLMGVHKRARIMFKLYIEEGLEYEQIAEALGVPVGTVKSSLSRARTAIRRSLAEAGLYSGEIKEIKKLNQVTVPFTFASLNKNADMLRSGLQAIRATEGADVADVIVAATCREAIVDSFGVSPSAADRMLTVLTDKEWLTEEVNGSGFIAGYKLTPAGQEQLDAEATQSTVSDSAAPESADTGLTAESESPDGDEQPTGDGPDEPDTNNTGTTSDDATTPASNGAGHLTNLMLVKMAVYVWRQAAAGDIKLKGADFMSALGCAVGTVHWAVNQLRKRGVIISPERGHYRRGNSVGVKMKEDYHFGGLTLNRGVVYDLNEIVMVLALPPITGTAEDDNIGVVGTTNIEVSPSAVETVRQRLCKATVYNNALELVGEADPDVALTRVAAEIDLLHAKLEGLRQLEEILADPHARGLWEKLSQ